MSDGLIVLFAIAAAMLIGAWFGAALAVGSCVQHGFYTHQLLNFDVKCSARSPS